MTTSKKVARTASQDLKKSSTPARQKTEAASALSQAAGKKKTAKKPSK